jgi:CheY-like chemotaxis protein
MKSADNATKTILVVEDDFTIRETLKEALEFEGYHVLTAENGQEGLVKIREVPQPCLVLLDLIMPVMGGREFLDAVLADVMIAPIPVLVLAALADPATTLGARGFMKKPPDLDLLMKMVAQYTAQV